MSAERNCFNVVNLRGEFVDIGAPHMGSHGQDGAVHITGYNTAKIHMESETKHVAGTQIVQAKDNNSDTIFSTDNGNRTLGFDAGCTVDFNNCTVQNLAGGGGGGGVSDPLNLNNINASVAMTTPILTPPAGSGLVISANGLQPTAGGTLNISASTLETVDGDISTSGTGSVRVQGTGFITSGTTISATGDISTGGNGDLVSGRDIYFDGIDVYKRTNVGGVVTNTEYSTFKGLAVKSAQNLFTDTNTFSGDIVMSGTGKTFANSQGTIVSGTSNIETMTCGTVDCDNGGTNSVAARTFALRTSGASTAGWEMKQDVPSVPAVFSDNVLQFTASQAGSFITIASSDYNPAGGGFPSILIDPVTVANGGRISCAEQIFGTTAGRFIIKQDNGGTLDNHLQISAGNASGEVRFKDDAGATTASISKTAVSLGDTIPLNYGAYSFRPVQYSLSIASFPISQNETNFTKVFTSVSQWTNVNTGATGQGITEGFYKLSVSQTGLSSPSGNYEGLGILCDFVYRIPADALPNNQLPNPLSFSYKKYLTSGAPEIEIRRNNTGGQDVHLTFPTSGTGGESMPLTVKLTKMDY